MELDEIVIEGQQAPADGAADDSQAETATGPVDGYVAKRTSTVSKTDASIMETPQAVSIIPAEQLQDQDVETLSEAVRYTPGVTSGFEGAGDTRRDPINIRGFETMQYLDGLLVPGGAVTYGITKPEPYGLERIEILKGPASVLYGQNAPGGLINMVSKRPTEEARGEVVIEGGLGAGAFEKLQGQFDVSGPVNADRSLLYRFVGMARDGNTMVDDQPDDRLFLAPSFTWKPTEDTTITWLNQYTKDNGGVYQLLPIEGTLLPNPNGQIPVSRNLGEPDFDHFKTDYWSTGYMLDHRFSDNVTFSQAARYGRYRDDYAGIYFTGLQPDMQTVDRTAYVYHTQVDSFSIDNRVAVKFDTGAVSHSALVGFDFTTTNYGDQVGDSEYDGVAVPPLDMFNPVYPGYPYVLSEYYRSSSTTKNTGLYAQDVLRYGRLTVMGGVRHDWAYDRSVSEDLSAESTLVSKQDPTATTFRAGAVYQFDNGLAPYASYAESFQLESGFSSFDQAFRPTTGQQYEVGLRYAIPDTDAMITVSAFDLTQQNVVTPDPDDPTGQRQIQTGEVNVKGVELEAKASLDSGWDITGGVSYMDGKVTESTIPGQIGLRTARTPEWMASLWVDYHFNRNDALGGLTIGGGVRHVGSFFPFQQDSVDTPVVPATTLFDAHLEYDFSVINKKYQGLSLNVTATNIFNELAYSEVGGDYVKLAPGREVSASLAYRW
ncbi:MAG: TonB-dependent siderophore receptor [Rhizobiaceae bacterium]